MDDLNETIEVQESSTKLLNFYVSDLLCLAQIEKGTFRKNISQFDIKEAVEEITKIQVSKAEAKQIQIIHQFEGFDQDFKVITDKMRVQQVLLSYQSNALKFTPVGGRIEIKLRNIDNQRLEIRVTDNGCGISKENQEKLFRIFGYLNENSDLNT